MNLDIYLYIRLLNLAIMQINSFSTILPPEQFGFEIDIFCDAARNQLSKAFLPYNKPLPQKEGILIIEIISDHLTSLGLICLTDIKDYQDNKFKAHEETISSKLNKQKEYLAKQGTFIKPVVAAVEDQTELFNWMAKRKANPVFKSFHSLKRNQIFNLWLVTDVSSVQEIKDIFKTKITLAIIADGHHRCAASKSLFEEGNTHFKYLLTAYFPVSQLKIRTFHRIYSLKNQTDTDLVLSHLSEHLWLTPLLSPVLPENKNELLIGLKDVWYKGIFKNLKSDKPNVICFEELLPSIIDIKNISNIYYPEDDISIQSFVSDRKGTNPILALSFFPIPKEDWVSAVQHQLFFPPKSTRFMPVLRSGLTMFDFKNQVISPKDEPIL